MKDSLGNILKDGDRIYKIQNGIKIKCKLKERTVMPGLVVIELHPSKKYDVGAGFGMIRKVSEFELLNWTLKEKK